MITILLMLAAGIEFSQAYEHDMLKYLLLKKTALHMFILFGLAIVSDYLTFLIVGYLRA